jgi:biotin carboxylase
MRHTVLVIGHRSQLCNSLFELDVDFFIWNDKPILQKKIPRLGELISPITDEVSEIIQTLSEINKLGHKFSHIIAGKEGAVIATAVAKDFFNLTKDQYKKALLCHNKWEMKKHLTSFDVPMTDFTDIADSENKLANWPLPLVMKPMCSSGGKGIEFLDSLESIGARRADYYLERNIDMDEGSTESFILDGEIIFQSTTRYLRKKHINLVPGNFNLELLNKIQHLNLKVLDALNIKQGMTHLEFYYDKDHILFGEIAIRPPGGHIMQLINTCFGIDPWKIYASCELGLRPEISQQFCSIAAAYILHPGSGEVKRILGEELLRQDKRIVKVLIKTKAGEKIKARASVSDDVGYLLLKTTTESEMFDLVDKIDHNFKIEKISEV